MVRSVPAAAASVNQKVLPWPSSLSAPISPPISSTSRLEIASPRPVPPYRRVVEPSAWVNGSNSRGELLGGDPDAGVGDVEAHEARSCASRSARATLTHDARRAR